MARKYRYGVCFKDIQCDDPKCDKTHPERKRLNICQFDIYFNPITGDHGCHFEDCLFYHIRRDEYYRRKDAEFDQLVDSVVRPILECGDSISLKDEYTKCMKNLYPYTQLEKSIFDPFHRMEAILPSSQTFYYETQIFIKGEYYAFIKKFNEMYTHLEDLFQETTKQMDQMMRIYPEFNDHTRILYENAFKLYTQTQQFYQFVNEEYKNTIQNYPNLV